MELASGGWVCLQWLTLDSESFAVAGVWYLFHAVVHRTVLPRAFPQGFQGATADFDREINYIRGGGALLRLVLCLASSIYYYWTSSCYVSKLEGETKSMLASMCEKGLTCTLLAASSSSSTTSQRIFCHTFLTATISTKLSSMSMTHGLISANFLRCPIVLKAIGSVIIGCLRCL